MFLKINNERPDPDLELIDQYRNSRDKAYIGELFQRYTPFVFGICLKYLQDEQISKDAVMGIFEKIIADLRLHDIKNFRPWLHTVSKNYCLTILRKEKSVQQQHEDYEKYKVSVVEFDLEKHLSINDSVETRLYLMEQAIEKLNKEQRTCVELFYLKQMSYQKITEITQYDLKQVKSYIQNGKRNLKNILEQELKAVKHG